MVKILLNIILVLAIIYIIPFIVYGLSSSLIGAKMPEGVSPLMFAIGEVGQAIGPNYSWKEAIAGVISETIYLPFSAYTVNWLIKV